MLTWEQRAETKALLGENTTHTRNTAHGLEKQSIWWYYSSGQNVHTIHSPYIRLHASFHDPTVKGAYESV